MRLYSQFLLNNAAANNTLDSRTYLSNRYSAPSTCRSPSVKWWTVRAIARAMMPLVRLVKMGDFMVDCFRGGGAGEMCCCWGDKAA